jgi:hypothetical protein
MSRSGGRIIDSSEETAFVDGGGGGVEKARDGPVMMSPRQRKR